MFTHQELMRINRQVSQNLIEMDPLELRPGEGQDSGSFLLDGLQHYKKPTAAR